MTKSRVEAFSDGVIAIVITIMVLELKMPHEPTLAALGPIWPVLLSYLFSFIFIGIYWNNHHHLFQAVNHVSGGVMWANMHLLFWLSLVPAVTSWIGSTHFAALPAALYGAVLLGAAIAFTILVRTLLKHHDADSPLAKAIGRDVKGNVSLACYTAAIPLAFVHPMIACALYVTVAVIWLVPDRRIERVLVPQDEA